MSDNENKVNQVIEKGTEVTTYAKAYVESQVAIKKIEASKLAGSGVSGLATALTITFALAGMFFFLLAALSVYLAQVLGSYVYAFLIIAAIILVSLLIYVLLFKPLVKKATTKAIGRAITGEELPSDETIASMKSSAKELENQLSLTAQEIPETLKGLKAVDLIPEKIAIGKKGNPKLKNKVVSFLLSQAINLIRKRLKK